MVSSKMALLAALAAPVLSDSHFFYSGFFSGSTIVGVEFDDAVSALTLKQNISTTNSTSGSKWIAMDERKKNIYVGTTGYFQSFAIESNNTLTYKSQVALSSSSGDANQTLDCKNANFIGVSSASPYTVFGTPYGKGCSTQVVTVDEGGSLQAAVAQLDYNTSSGVHGTDLSPANDFIYSADDMGNAVWTHSFQSKTGAAKVLQKLDAPQGSDPRHLAVHPNGMWVYVVYEAGNSIAVYKRDNDTGLLTDLNTTYPLIPSTFTNGSSYWADEVMFSLPSTSSAATSPKYLLAATRSRNTNATGYISALSLDANTGAIDEQLFLTPSTASGGSANAVSPAPFSEDYFAITDSGSNFVEVWKIDEVGKSAKALAHLGVQSGPANVVWYS